MKNIKPNEKKNLQKFTILILQTRLLQGGGGGGGQEAQKCYTQSYRRALHLQLHPMGKLTEIDNITQGAGCCLKNQSNKSHQSEQSPHLSPASVYSEMQQ